LPVVGQLKWFKNVKMPSLFRFHQVAGVVVWIVIAFTIWNTGYWIFTTEVWVPN